MSDTEQEYEPLNGIVIELQGDLDGNIIFSGGWEFDDDINPEYVEYMQTLLSGMYAMVSTQLDNVLAAGEIIRAAPGFDESIFMPQSNEELDIEVDLEADDEKIVNFAKRTFKKGKDKKH
jgi:hypothetical protein